MKATGASVVIAVALFIVASAVAPDPEKEKPTNGAAVPQPATPDYADEETAWEATGKALNSEIRKAQAKKGPTPVVKPVAPAAPPVPAPVPDYADQETAWAATFKEMNSATQPRA